MDRRIGLYDVKTEARLRAEGGFEAYWVASWMPQGGHQRMWMDHSCGPFASGEAAKAFAEEALAEWCQANPIPPV